MELGGTAHRWPLSRGASALAGATVLAALVAGCGGASTVKSTSLADTVVSVSVTSPSNGTVINGERVTVRGTVSPADASVELQGKPAPAGAGQFAKSVALHPGTNTIEVTASATGMAPATTSVAVTRASKPHVNTQPVTEPKEKPNPVQPAGGWPADTSAWTVVLASEGAPAAAQAAAARAAGAGLPDAGVLLSSQHSSLRPGYWVAYTGVLSHEQAVARQSQARAAGFPTAYARFVSAR